MYISTDISAGGGEKGSCSPPPSWAEIRFTRANFLKEQLESRATSLPALQLYLIFRAEHSQPPQFDALLPPCRQMHCSRKYSSGKNQNML